MWAALATTLLFSISAIAATRMTKVMGGVKANFWRMILATIFLGILAHWLGHGLGSPGRWVFFWSGISGFGVADIALYQALPRLGSRLSVLLVHCLAAPFAALVEWMWLGTVLDAAQLICGAAILAGVCLAIAPGKLAPIDVRERWRGVAFGVVAGLGQGGGAVLSRKAYALAKAGGVSVDGFSAAYERIWGGIIVAGSGYLLLKWRENREERAREWPNFKKASSWMTLNAVAGPVLGVSCYQLALGSIPTGVVLPIVALTPLVILPFSRWVENEKPTARSLAGGVIAVGAVVALVWLRNRAAS